MRHRCARRCSSCTARTTGARPSPTPSSCSCCCASAACRRSSCVIRARSTGCPAPGRPGSWWTGWSGSGLGSRTGWARATRPPRPARCTSLVTLVISSPQTLRRLNRLRGLNARLADPRTLRSTRETEEALRDGKTVVLITSGIHSNEVGGHLTPVVLAHRLATDTSAATRAILDNVILLLVPSLNPDGVTIVTRWYNRTLGAPAERTEPPELYHHYAGPAHNRDWYAFTQGEPPPAAGSAYN